MQRKVFGMHHCRLVRKFCNIFAFCCKVITCFQHYIHVQEVAISPESISLLSKFVSTLTDIFNSLDLILQADPHIWICHPVLHVSFAVDWKGTNVVYYYSKDACKPL